MQGQDLGKLFGSGNWGFRIGVLNPFSPPPVLVRLGCQETLNGDILKGDIWNWNTEILTRHVDFKLEFALGTSILTALPKAILEGKRRLKRDSSI